MGAGEPRVLLFLRHVGCAFGERMLADIREAAQAFPDVQFIAIAHGEPDAATAWCEDLGFTRVHVENAGQVGTADEWCRDPDAENLRVFVDENRELYAEWGLGLGGLDHLLNPRVMASKIRARLDGFSDREPSGTRWQRAGMFAVDPDGTVRARHVSAYAGDLPDIEVAATFLDTEPVQTAAEASFSRVTPTTGETTTPEATATTGTATGASDSTVEDGEPARITTDTEPAPREVTGRAQPAVEPAPPEPRSLEAAEPAIRPVAEPAVEPAVTRIEEEDRVGVAANGTAEADTTDDGVDETEESEEDRERLRLGGD
jgi:hypothetical protein